MWERVLGGYVGMGLGESCLVKSIKDEVGSVAKPQPLETPPPRNQDPR